MKLHRTSFADSQLKGVDFTEADLRNALFRGCDLLNATFEHTNLEYADLRTSLNYSMDPENNRLKGAIFSVPGVLGLLDKYQIEIDPQLSTTR